MTDTARAFWTVGPGCGVLRAEETAAPGPGAVRIATRMSAISRGTETLVFQGRVPESEWARMRCPHQSGAFPFPVKYGYAAVGIVEAVGPEVAMPIGTRVFCLHPHQDRFVVAADMARPIPSGVPDARATLAANVETALNALWDAGVTFCDRIAVVGCGVVGSAVAALAAQVPGAHVLMVDPASARGPLAAALGCAYLTPDAVTGSGGAPWREACDVVFHASGRSKGLTTAIALAGFEARVVELSWYGTAPVSVGLGGAFHAKRLALVASQVGHVAGVRRARLQHAGRLDRALAVLEDARFDRLIDDEVPFDRLPAAMAELCDPALAILARLVRY